MRKAGLLLARTGIIIAVLFSTCASVLVPGLLPPSTTNLLASDSPPADDVTSTDPSVSSIQIGLTGSIETAVVVADLGDDGQKEVLLGTSKGLYIIAPETRETYIIGQGMQERSQGVLRRFIPTPGSVSDIMLLPDITDDGQGEVVVAVDDTYFPNIRCYDSASGDKLWHFAPKQEVFLDNILWTEQQTRTFDIAAIEDINSDGYPDLAATSGYCLYALDGRTGEMLWKIEAENNLWRISPLPDLDGDSVNDLAVGAQSGFMYVISATGEVLWQDRISQKCTVLDEKGNEWAEIDRSVWDIVPISMEGVNKAVVSSEDGQVRLVDLSGGSRDWETAVVTYTESMLLKYYEGKQKLPSGPGDDNFFNIELSLVDDVNEDGTQDILASTYVGHGGGGKGKYGMKTSGIFLMDAVSGTILWKNTGMNLESTGKVEAIAMGEGKVILLPQGKSQSQETIRVINAADGQWMESMEIASSPEGVPSSEYWAIQFTEDSFLLVSDYTDLLCLSSQAEVLWTYPRISDVFNQQGDFTGDETKDLFVWSRYVRTDQEGFGARVLYLIDGATRQKAWSYELSYQEFAANWGITGVFVTPDLNHDGKQDIAGYILPSAGNDPLGEQSRIVVFSGSDGSILLDQPVVAQTYYGAFEEIYQDPDYPAMARQKLYDYYLQKWVEEMQKAGWTALQIQSRKASFIQNELPKMIADALVWLAERKPSEIINKRILSLGIMDVPGMGEGIAFVVGTPHDIFMISPAGELLWTKTYQAWRYQDPITREIPTNVKFGGEQADLLRYRVLDDINGDGLNDLLIFVPMALVIATSTIEGGDINFQPARTIVIASREQIASVVGQMLWQITDADGDGIRDILFVKFKQRVGVFRTIISTASGETLLELGQVEGQTLVPVWEDFNGDGFREHLLFQSWDATLERPKLEVLDGRSGEAVWEFTEFKDSHLFDRIDFDDHMPAAPISDMNGDGLPELAMIKTLMNQPGAKVVIYDISTNDVLKEITVEEIDQRRTWEQRWHPGVLIREVNDLNGDGVKEIALVAMLGDEEDKKEARLVVVDMVAERVIADFRLAGYLPDIGQEDYLGVVGLSGEVYFLNMTSSLNLISPTDGSSQTSPVAIQWEGTAPGAFNQVSIDGIEVARTNDSEVALRVARGEHELTVRSLDEYGRGVYTAVNFTVAKGSSVVILAFVALGVFVGVAFVPVVFRLVTKSRRRRRRA